MKVISPASLMAHTPSPRLLVITARLSFSCCDLAVEIRIGQGDRTDRGQRLEQRPVGVVEGLGAAPAGHAEPERLTGYLHRGGRDPPRRADRTST